MNYNQILESVFKALVKAEMIASGKNQTEAKKIVMDYMKSDLFYNTFKSKLIESVK
jgi:hypothetical protein